MFWWLISWLFSRFLEGVFKCLLNFRHESGNKSDFSELFNILWNQLDAVFSFIFFTWRNQNQNGTTEWPAVEQRQDQQEVIYIFFFYDKYIYKHRWLEITSHNMLKLCHLLWHYLQFLQELMFFAFNLMHDWKAMDGLFGTEISGPLIHSGSTD